MAPSNTVPAGNIISENPVAGTQVSAGSAVNLVVSTGSATSVSIWSNSTTPANPWVFDQPLTLGVKFRSEDRKSTRLNSSHVAISYAVFCLKKIKKSGGAGLGQGAL